MFKKEKQPNAIHSAKTKEDEIVVKGWHLKKEITLGQLITILTIFGSGLWWGLSVEQRMIKQMDETIRLEGKFDLQQTHIQRTLDRLDKTITKLTDKMGEHPHK